MGFLFPNSLSQFRSEFLRSEVHLTVDPKVYIQSTPARAHAREKSQRNSGDFGTDQSQRPRIDDRVLITLQTASRTRDIPYSTLREYIRRGLLNAHRFGRRVRVSAKELDELLMGEGQKSLPTRYLKSISGDASRCAIELDLSKRANSFFRVPPRCDG